MIVFVVNATDRYRLELLAELAARFPETVPAATVADRRGIPAPYLAQLVRELARHAVVETRRGPGGGIRLALPPHEIPLDRVLAPPAPGNGEEGATSLGGRLREVVAGALGSVSAADLVIWERESAPNPDYVI